ncbi:MAG TPA: OmpA family protein [Thiobacillus sp.]
MRTTPYLSTMIGVILLSASAFSAHAADGQFYDPSNAASPTGYTIGYELFRTIGCPGRGLLDTPCPVSKPPVSIPPISKPAASPAPQVAASPTPNMVDSDGDGVEDARDKCPNTPQGWKVNAEGCPLDTDGDGVPDNIDRCPTVFAQTADGCPEAAVMPTPAATAPLAPTPPIATTVPALPAVLPEANYTVSSATDPIEIPRRLILEGVHFDFDRATLRHEDLAIIDKNVLVLKDWGNIKIEISGHTDSVGSDRYNMGLSLRRAHAVRDYLISKGIPASHLIATGFGESDPVESNDTDAGRAKNRRVELNQISQ